MISFMPWNADFSKCQSNLIIVHGKDQSLCYSFLHSSNYQYLDINNILSDLNTLYSDNLFEEKKNIYSIASYNNYKIIIKHYANQKFNQKLLLYTDKIDKTYENIDYIKCDSIPSYKRKEFIKFHSKNNELINENWIKNLDDLKFAQILKKVDMKYMQNNNETLLDPWVRLYMLQYKSEKNFKYIYKHFEQWARYNSPSNEILDYYLDQIAIETKQCQESANV